MKILIRGGRVIDPAAGLDGPADVLIENGVIVAVERGIETEGARTVNAAGLVVTPGFVDMHVHFREPGQEYKEDIASGSRAAVAGGFTTVACMPNTSPPVDNEAIVSRIVRRAAEAGLCRVHPIAAITKGLGGEELTEMMVLRDAGAVGFSDDGRPVESSRVLRRALEYARLTGAPIISHCEDTALSAGGHMHEGAVSTRLGIEGIPGASEDVAVAREIRLAEITGGRLHVCHVSTARSVEHVRQAKERGVRVTAEVTPHHLALTDEAVEGFDPNTKMNPPLRAEADRLAIIRGVADGTLDAVATDHAPHAEVEKLVEYDRAPFGIIGLETAFALASAVLVDGGHLALADLIERMTIAPARILGLDAGTLRPGQPADVTVIDPDLAWTFGPEDVFSRSKNTPFLGRRFRGRVLLTLLAGNAVHERAEMRGRLALGGQPRRLEAAAS
ncbi:MAG: dihydroorotase [Candidatus Eiseniibacteriota bacterium]